MKVELKKFAYFASGSEETNAFTADVYVDGRKTYYASNDGHGGMTNVQLVVDRSKDPTDAIEAELRAMPVEPKNLWGKDLDVQPRTIDELVDALVEDILDAREYKRVANRILKGKVVFAIKGHSGLRQVKCVDSKVARDHITKRHGADIVFINDFASDPHTVVRFQDIAFGKREELEALYVEVTGRDAATIASLIPDTEDLRWVLVELHSAKTVEPQTAVA